MTTLNKATILITGATGGFGQEMVKQFLEKNGRLILTDLDQTRLAELAQSIEGKIETGEIVACFAANLATVEGCQKLYHFYQSLDMPLDLLVNNAGVAAHGRFDEMPTDYWEKIMQINLLAPLHLVHAFVPNMIAQKRGHIVNIASIAGWVGSAGLAVYSATKYGLRGFSEALYEEVKPYGVQVTTVYPFFSRTPILNSPRFGTMQRGDLPDGMITDPSDVIREVVAGIEQNKHHIFPDKTARRMHILKRYWPSLLYRATNRLEKKLT